MNNGPSLTPEQLAQLQALGDLGELGEALKGISEVQKMLAKLPCSKHPKRKAVVLAPGLAQGRMCRQCFVAYAKRNPNEKVKKIADYGAVDAELLASTSDSPRDEPSTGGGADRKNVGKSRSKGQRNGNSRTTGAGAGGTKPNASGSGDVARGVDADAEPSYVDAYERGLW